jgi:hypothetical protein
MKQAVKDRLNAVLVFIRAQLQETSTLRGLALLLGSFALFAGYDPTVVLTLTTFAAGLLAVMLPDKLK